ncbi:MAG TPA: PP2C family protein-serine/threonine phosphatase [Leptospiraceae bacterium]|nr:PP2C family protein-serine/threonine phosphatase [Leptospiraceae bacterium]HRG74596.1 PP2C family protein-serine/threonine phosphatase [Leptospiraceae bacterium]
MKNYIVIILGALCFVALTLFTFKGVGLDASHAKRFLYYYPNGLIANADLDNIHMIGVNMYEEKIPPIRIKIKEDNNLLSLISFQYKTILDFIPYIIISLIFLISSFWFLLKYGDIYLFLFFLDISIFIYSNFVLLAFDAYHFWFYLTFYLLGFFIMHMGFRLKGKDVSIRWLMPEICASIIVAVIGTSEKLDPVIFTKLTTIGVIAILIGTVGCLSVLIYDILKYKLSANARLQKIILIVAISLLVLLPYFSFQFNLFTVYPFIQYISYFGFLIFPFLFIYGTYRYSFMPEQVYFSSSVTTMNLAFAFICLYGVLIALFNFLTEGLFIKNLQLFNILFLLLSIYSVVTVKQRIKKFMEYWTLGRNKKLNQTLEEMALLISSPFSLRATVRQLVRKVNEALDIQKVIILVASDRFPTSDFKNIDMVKLHNKSEIWNYFENEKDVTITSSLMFGSGIRDSVYNFLRTLNIQLAFPMYGFDEKKSITAMFLVGERNVPRNFTLGELSFIKECTRLTDLLLYNYQLLIADVEKKKMEKSLKEATILEETIHPSSNGILNLRSTEFAYLSLAAMSISGDYVDFIRLNDRQVIILLGDVSGHGLGSGYLVSAIKALVHDQIESGIDIVRLFRNINNFLIERYAGNEFMTLIGGLYDASTGVFEFINAGHLSPIILRENGSFETIKSGHRILGVIPSPFTTDEIRLNLGDRLILYSDGITETFSPSEEIYGETRFRKFLVDNKHLSSQKLLSALENVLKDFRNDGELTDDMSLIFLKRL